MDETKTGLLNLTADVVAAHVANNSVAISDVPDLIASVHAAFGSLGAASAAALEPQKPAVTIRASVKPDRLICLEDGLSMKMLKRHLRTDHDMTPAQYREKWKLPADYPMVASHYREMRSALAKSIGLGRKRAVATPAPRRKRPAV
jgi:predicted transcriptional regulator